MKAKSEKRKFLALARPPVRKKKRGKSREMLVAAENECGSLKEKEREKGRKGKGEPNSVN